jgi:hypothetical protein
VDPSQDRRGRDPDWGLVASNVWHVEGIVVMMIGWIFVVAARWIST